MQTPQSHRAQFAVAAGLLLPLAVAAVLVPFRNSFADTASALILVAVIVAVAALGSRMGGLIAAVSAGLWFDLFLTRPYGHFTITHSHDIETTISLFVVGVAVTELAARNRYHHRVAVEESDYLGLLYYLAELTATGATSSQVIEQANAELVDLLRLRDSRYETDVVGQKLPRIELDGEVHLGRVRWNVEQLGLPGDELELPVQSHGELLGRFVLHPTPGAPVSMQRRVVAVSIADQVGAALTPRLPTEQGSLS